MSELEVTRYQVFTAEDRGGGPLAIVDCRSVNKDEVSSGFMQKLALDFELPETTFIFEPINKDSLAQVRIFTMEKEVTLAGNPTIGTALHLFSTTENCPEEFVLDLGVGPTRIEIDNTQDQISAYMEQQPCEKFDAANVNVEKLFKSLGIKTESLASGENDAFKIEFFSAGLTFLIVPITSKQVLNEIKPNQRLLEEALSTTKFSFIYTFAVDELEKGRVNARMFCGSPGDLLEDPATGSAAGALMHYLNLYASQLVNSGQTLTITQGEKMGSLSKIFVSLVKNKNDVLVPRVGGTGCLVSTEKIRQEKVFD